MLPPVSSCVSLPPWHPLGSLPSPYNPKNGAGPPPATATTAVAAWGLWDGGVGGAEPTTQAQGHCSQSQNGRIRLQAQACCPGREIKAHRLNKTKGYGRALFQT